MTAATAQEAAQIDWETRAVVDLKHGVYRYAEDENTGIWCLAWCLPTGEEGSWEPGEPDRLTGTGVRLRLQAERATALPAEVGRFTVGVRPERLAPAGRGDAESASCTVEGVVEVVEPLGSEQHVVVAVGDDTVTAKRPREEHFEIGEKVVFAVDPAHLHVFDAESGEALWINYPVPRIGQPGDETWAGLPMESRIHTGVWGALSYDPESGLVYYGSSSTAPSSPTVRGTGDAILAGTDTRYAVNLKTGEIAWQRQIMPGAQWDDECTFEAVIDTVALKADPKA